MDILEEVIIRNDVIIKFVIDVIIIFNKLELEIISVNFSVEKIFFYKF